MKNIKKLLAVTFVLMLSSAYAIYAVPPAVEKTLEDNVRSEIRKLNNYGVFDSIEFEIDGTTVILSGKLYNTFNRKTIQKRVEKLEGVERVVNNIKNLPPSSFDNRIRRSTLRSFVRSGSASRYLVGFNPPVRIIVDRGHITLVGEVRSESDSILMNILANHVSGVFSVTNELKVARKL